MSSKKIQINEILPENLCRLAPKLMGKPLSGTMTMFPTGFASINTVKTSSQLPELGKFAKWKKKSLAEELPVPSFAWGASLGFCEKVPDGPRPLFDPLLISAKNTYLLSSCCIFLVQKYFPVLQDVKHDYLRYKEKEAVEKKAYEEHEAALETIAEWKSEGLLDHWQVIYAFSDMPLEGENGKLLLELRRVDGQKQKLSFASMAEMEKWLRQSH